MQDEVKFYNLDAIIAVGYRVNSKKATAFRVWATNTFGKDYFKELLERVRSIRASERRIWLQITDIFAEISVDYKKAIRKAHAEYNESRGDIKEEGAEK